MEKLIVSEIFASIQGEGTRAGLPCAFVRLAGCNLRCRYCDTPYAREVSDGREVSVEAAVNEACSFGLPLVQVTGGEPLLQAACTELVDSLLERGVTVLLETNGSLDLSSVDPRVVKIVDIKCPGSGAGNSFRRENIVLLSSHDEVKFVISDNEDYEWARAVIARERLDERCEVLLSPANGLLEPKSLAEWMLADRVPARLQLQLHALIWGGERGR